ncbi:hypothetical protein, partial [Fischerella thermalis]|uniref:hypothetical protein n=1 Tax=Fischerella thermalis TaxID=372787 RepID=UPI001CA4B0B4
LLYESALNKFLGERSNHMRLPKGRIRMVNRCLHFRSSCGTLGYTEGDRNLHLRGVNTRREA